mmetsp:Transcript_20002/g.62108  ORF Transcript_20002/g.62108 Transcript_20002/m.62108 type:complete len:236 (-) Transcript_20002:353-1060(-)
MASLDGLSAISMIFVWSATCASEMGDTASAILGLISSRTFLTPSYAPAHAGFTAAMTAVLTCFSKVLRILERTAHGMVSLASTLGITASMMASLMQSVMYCSSPPPELNQPQMPLCQRARHTALRNTCAWILSSVTLSEDEYQRQSSRMSHQALCSSAFSHCRRMQSRVGWDTSSVKSGNCSGLGMSSMGILHFSASLMILFAYVSLTSRMMRMPERFMVPRTFLPCFCWSSVSQ